MDNTTLNEPVANCEHVENTLDLISKGQSRLEENYKKLIEEHQKFSMPKSELEEYQSYFDEAFTVISHDDNLLNTRIVKIESYIDRFSKYIDKTKVALKSSNENNTSLSEELNEAEKQLSELETRREQLLQKKKNLEDYSLLLYEKTIDKNEKVEAFLSNNSEINQKLLEKNEKLSKESNNYATSLVDLSERYDLVSSAISTNVIDSERYQKFTEHLYNDFIPFINEVNILPNEAELVIQLKAIQDQLYLLESLGGFKDKSIVAVSGGFSSGKSSFISSLFSDHDIQLPIGIEPVTAIPTYVLDGVDNRISGLTNKGGEVEISSEIYKKISHEYIEEFGFNFRDLMPFIILETPIPTFNHMSFIDLPGYNPGVRAGYEGEDKGSAEEYMAQAQYVLWVIGLDANGTVSRDDIDFLVKGVPEGAELYIIINKADLRAPSQLSAVMEEVSDMLYMEGVEYRGISSYSSVQKKELDFIDESLFDVLASWNTPRDVYKQLHEDLKQVFDQYVTAFESDLENRKEKKGLIKAVELDLFELGTFNEDTDRCSFDSLLSNMYNRSSSEGDKQDRVEKIAAVRTQLSDLKQDYNQKLPKDQLKKLKGIRDSMLYSLKAVT